MDDTSARRIEAGLSFLFAPGERPGAAALRTALASGQARAQVTRESSDVAEIVASGLVFEVDGLANEDADHDGAAVRLYPGHHLSGGATLAPVTRALLALAAELAVSLPVQLVHWHPAGTTMDPQTFSRSALAWLAGGAFPALGLTDLSTLADGSVVSRGLAHFTGQEVTVRGRPDDTERTGKLAARVVGRLVETGPLQALTRLTIDGEVLCAEPAIEARHVLVWAE